MSSHLSKYLAVKFEIYFYSNIKLLNLNINFSQSIFVFSITVYVLLLLNLFLIFFLFNNNSVKTLNDLKVYNNVTSISIFIIFLLLSFSGVPPFIGFISKFLIFITIFSKQYFFLFFWFLLLNIFIIYFYIQNIRFITTSKTNINFLKKNFKIYLNKKIIFCLNLLGFFNLLGLFYFEEFLIFLNFIISNLYF